MDILSQFGVKPILLAAQVVNFLILLFILKKLLYKPILKVLDERKKRIEESLRNAEEIEKKLLQTEEEKEKILEKASKDAQKIIDEGKTAVAQMMGEGRDDTAKLVQSMMKEGQEAIGVEREKMQNEMREELSTIVVAALEKVTGKVVTKKDQKEMIERTVRGLS